MLYSRGPSPESGSMTIRQFINEIVFKFAGRKKRFIHIYKTNWFGGYESISGPGSSLEQTHVVRKELPGVIREFNIRKIIDAPCGDFHWMKEVVLDVDTYIGIDIVPEIILGNREKYGNNKREFHVKDIVKDTLPHGDLILCRDCFIHLSFKDIFSAIRNFDKSGSRYLLTTTFTGLNDNTDIVSGKVRPLNMQKPPFNFPAPLLLINENCTEEKGRYSDKSLGFWEIAKIQKKFL
jgi:hypothetical protein